MFVVLLSIYLILCFRYRKNKVLLILFFLQVISLSSTLLINLDSYSDDIKTYFSVPFILVSTLLLIFPWKNYGKVVAIDIKNENRINVLTNILLIISAFTFIILAAVVYVVQMYIGNDVINEFKDETTNFYYTMLPFDVHWYLWARILYTFSYFLIPLHYYYLYRGNLRKSYLCAFFSLNIILYGLAFFSRWTIMLFVSLYMVMWFMYNNVLPTSSKEKEKRIMVSILVILLIVFSGITIGRFASDDGVSTRYANKIPIDSPVQDPALYSILDYLGQSNSIGIRILNDYKGQMFGPVFPLMGIQNLLAGVGLTPPSSAFDLHEKHWGEYWDKFPGFTPYGVYDLGYVGALLACFFYYLIVRKRRKTISVNEMLFSVILLQMPICSIFYSQASEVVYDLLFYIPLALYLKTGTSIKKTNNEIYLLR